jgi:hypothetical protein
MSKYYVSWYVEEVDSKNIVLVDIALTNNKEDFTSRDVISWMVKLGIYWKPFDNEYSKYDMMRVQKSDNYVLSFFYSHNAKAIYLSITCNDFASKEKLVVLLEEIKTLKHD